MKMVKIVGLWPLMTLGRLPVKAILISWNWCRTPTLQCVGSWDYGKFKFDQEKKAQLTRRKQKQIQVKEVKFRPGTDERDYQTKLKNLVKFLMGGDKTKITVRFRGREMVRQERGLVMLKRVEADLQDYGVVEQYPKVEGRQMIMVMSPKK